jgi:hypothetical protein
MKMLIVFYNLYLRVFGMCDYELRNLRIETESNLKTLSNKLCVLNNFI